MKDGFRSLLRVLVIALAAVTVSGGLLPPHTPQPASAKAEPASAYVTLLFGRTQWASADPSCVSLPGAVTLNEIAAELWRRGLSGTGAVVTGYAGETLRHCMVTSSTSRIIYASWQDLAALRDTYGWTFVSASKSYANMTKLTNQAQYDQSCGSLPTFEAHGHLRAWGLFAYPNNKSSYGIQATVVSDCFAFGRKYGPGPNLLATTTYPWFQSTVSIMGGRCHDPTMPCASVPVKNDRVYMDPARIADRLRAAPGEWRSVQAYRFVRGERAAGSAESWDCTSPDWRRHWSNRPETYCWNDYLTALDAIPSGTIVTDPATVATAWGRLP